MWDLRLADAHLAGQDVDDSLSELGVDQASPPVFQGYQLMRSCVNGLYAIVKIVARWKEPVP